MPCYVMFEDGPAKEAACLMLERCPLYLRVVRSMDGKWDALDQLDDDPALGETIFIYKRCSQRAGHIKGATRAQSGPMFMYQHTEDISPEGMDDRDAWHAAVEALVGEPVTGATAPTHIECHPSTSLASTGSSSAESRPAPRTVASSMTLAPRRPHAVGSKTYGMLAASSEPPSS